jgi:hypothetical protein
VIVNIGVKRRIVFGANVLDVAFVVSKVYQKLKT